MSDYLKAFGYPNYDYYETTEQIGFLPVGTIFVHDKNDHDVGSAANGCLKLCWGTRGECQGNSAHQICGGTVIFHSDFIEVGLFKRVASDKLKPCPFCGGVAVYTSNYERKGIHCCYCSDCGAGTCFISGASSDSKKKAHAINLWNRRIEDVKTG